MTNASISIQNIYLYPLKSFNRVKVFQTNVLSSGALEYDRAWCLKDAQGRFIQSKKRSDLHLFQIDFSLDFSTWTLEYDGKHKSTFHVENEQISLQNWFSEHLGEKVTLCDNHHTGFPDDLEANGPTLISLASLEELTRWYPDLSQAQLSLRFRSNVEISAPQAFWEDRLVSTKNKALPFRLGELPFYGLKNCARCIVPSRDENNGQPDPKFIATFKSKREQSLPPWAERSRFDHFYRIAINTSLKEWHPGGVLSCGDALSL